MNKPTKILFAALTITALVAGCSAFKYGAPPTATEQKFFDVQTNYVPVVKTVTNTVPVTLYQTNVVPVTVTTTNNQTVTEFRTNVVPVAGTRQELELVTNQQPTYTYNPNANAQAVKDTIGGIAAPFGYGGVATTAVSAILALWGWVRSSKLKNTGISLAQSIETLREFVKNMPNGAIYDNALTQWLSDHQKETGTVTQVLTLLDNNVSNSDAQIAAQQIRAAITALNPSAVPPIVPKP